MRNLSTRIAITAIVSGCLGLDLFAQDTKPEPEQEIKPKPELMINLPGYLNSVPVVIRSPDYPNGKQSLSAMVPPALGGAPGGLFNLGTPSGVTPAVVAIPLSPVVDTDSDGRVARFDDRDHVLLTNVGGNWFVPTRYLLAGPGDPSDPFLTGMDELEARFNDGMMLPLNLTNDVKDNPILRFDGYTTWGFQHDSGFTDTNKPFVNGISLLGRNDPQARQTRFFGTGEKIAIPVRLFSDVQLLDFGGYQVQGLVELNNYVDGNELDEEFFALGARDRATDITLVIGEVTSLFGFADLQPGGLTSNRQLVGSLDRGNANPRQLRVHIPLATGVMWNVALEHPDVSGKRGLLITPAAGAGGSGELTRFPTLASSVTIGSGNSVVEFAGLVRDFGFRTPAVGGVFGREYATGWGMSGLAKLSNDESTVFAGLVGGSGIANYISGFSTSAIATPTDVSTVESFSAIAGLRHLWKCDSADTYQLNAAYGYGFNRVPETLASTSDRKLHQAWINLIRTFGSNLIAGIEYQYGFREVASHDSGENHQLTFQIGLRTTPKGNAKTGSAQSFASYDKDALREKGIRSSRNLDGTSGDSHTAPFRQRL